MATIRVNCPNCQARFVVDKAHVGKIGRCKQCGAKVPIQDPNDPDCEEQVAVSQGPGAPYRDSQEYKVLRDVAERGREGAPQLPRGVSRGVVERLLELERMVKALPEPTDRTKSAS